MGRCQFVPGYPVPFHAIGTLFARCWLSYVWLALDIARFMAEALRIFSTDLTRVAERSWSDVEHET